MARIWLSGDKKLAHCFVGYGYQRLAQLKAQMDLSGLKSSVLTKPFIAYDNQKGYVKVSSQQYLGKNLPLDNIEIFYPEPFIGKKFLGEETYLFLAFMDIYANPTHSGFPEWWDALIVWRISTTGGAFNLTPVPASILSAVITPSIIDTFTSLLTVQSNPNATKHSIRLPNVWYAGGDPTAFRLHTYRTGIGGAMEMEAPDMPLMWKMYGDYRIVTTFDDPWTVQIGHPYPFKPEDFADGSAYSTELILPDVDVWDMPGYNTVNPVLSVLGFSLLGTGRKPFVVEDNKMTKRYIGIYGDTMYMTEQALLVNGEDPIAYGVSDGVVLLAWENENSIDFEILDTYHGLTTSTSSTFGGWVDNTPQDYNIIEDTYTCGMSGGCQYSGQTTSKSPLAPVLSDSARDNFINYYAVFNDSIIREERDSITQIEGHSEGCALANKNEAIISSLERYGYKSGYSGYVLCYTQYTTNTNYIRQTIDKVVTVTDTSETRNFYVGDRLFMSLLSTVHDNVESSTQNVYNDTGTSRCVRYTCELPLCWWTGYSVNLPVVYDYTYTLNSARTKDWGYPEGYYRHPVLRSVYETTERRLGNIQDYDYDSDDFILLAYCTQYDYRLQKDELHAPGVTLSGANPWEKLDADMPVPRPHTYDRSNTYTNTYRLFYSVNEGISEIVLPYSNTKVDTFSYDWEESIKAAPVFTEVVGKWQGEVITGFSCQVYKNYIVYTYDVYQYDDDEDNTLRYLKKMLGIINRSDPNLDIGAIREFTISGDLPIYDENINYQDLAAIGIHKKWR